MVLQIQYNKIMISYLPEAMDDQGNGWRRFSSPLTPSSSSTCRLSISTSLNNNQNVTNFNKISKTGKIFQNKNEFIFFSHLNVVSRTKSFLLSLTSASPSPVRKSAIAGSCWSCLSRHGAKWLRIKQIYHIQIMD